MKLLGVNYNKQVESLGRRDITAPGREAAAAVNLSMQQQKLPLQILDTANQMYGTLVEHRARTSDTEYKLGMEQYQQDIGTREFFSAAEVPDGIEVERYEKINGVDTERERIPSWEVYPQMLQKHSSTLISDLSASIPEAWVAEKWAQGAEISGTKSVTLATKNAANAQQQEVRNQSRTDIKSFIEIGDWKSAIMTARTFPGTTAEREAITLAATETIQNRKQELEMEIYFDVMSDKPTGISQTEQLYHITQSIDILEDHEYAGDVVDESARFRILEQLRSKRASVLRQNESALKVKNVALKRKINKATQAQNAGHKLEDGVLLGLQKEIKERGVANDPGFFNPLADFAEATLFANNVNSFLQQNSMIRDAELRKMGEGAKTPEALLLVDKFGEASAQFERDLANDPLSAASQVDMIPLWPIDFNNLAAELEDRKTNAHIVQDVTGHFNGYLTKDEVSQFADLIDKAPAAGKLSLIGEIHAGLGADASKFYDQLNLKKSVPAFTMAGKRSAEGDRRTAALIMQGHDVLKEYPELIKAKHIDFEPKIEEMVGDAYAYNPADMAMVKDAIYKVYAAMSINDGDYQASGADNEDRLVNAMQAVTGELAVVNDAKVEAPKDVTPDIFEDWAMTLSSKAIPSAMNFAPSKITRGLREGDITLVGTGQRGTYRLKYERDGRLLWGANGRPYTITYSADMPRRKVATPWWKQVGIDDAIADEYDF